MSASVLILLSYGLLAVFVVAFVLRSAKLARMPVHLRWELSPVPHEKGKGGYGGSYLEEVDWWTKPREKDHLSEILYMGKEILFLKALWEHKRSLWWFSFPFHFGLYLLTVALGLLVLGAAAAALGIAGPGFGMIAYGLPLLAGVGYALGAVGAVGLFVTRLTDAGMKNSTSPMTYFNLLLLLGLFGTGLWAIAAQGPFHLEALGFVGALFSGGSAGVVSTPLAAHVLFAGVFLAYLPFTPMMHFVAKYFTYHKVRWDDEPVASGSKLDRELKKLLGQTPTWAAPHVGADGKKTWVDIAMDTGKKVEAGK
jgi:nitrate reductase gamma subunit